MSIAISNGDIVTITARDAGGGDAKSGLFYPHYRGLSGTVAKVYADGTAAVTIDTNSMPEALRLRHEAGSEAQRRKWLEGLSEEARNRLSPAEKKFSLRYTVLVATADLQKQARKSSSDLDVAEEQFLESRQRKD
jgi:hypothetical protein